jgi:hypothetical protein
MRPVRRSEAVRAPRMHDTTLISGDTCSVGRRAQPAETCAIPLQQKHSGVVSPVSHLYANFHHRSSSWSRVLLYMLIVAQLVKNSSPFMEPEGLLPCSQQPATGPYPEPDASSPQLRPYFPKIHSNIILSPMLRSSENCLPFRFSDQNFVCISRSLPCLLHVPPILSNLTW